MNGHAEVFVWVGDDDTWTYTTTAASAFTQRGTSLTIGASSPAALRELSDFLLMAASELERRQRDT